MEPEDDKEKPAENPENSEAPSEEHSSEASESPEKSEDSNDSDTNENQQAPADALSMTPEELEEEAEKSGQDDVKPEESEEKKLPFLKRIFRKVNVYFLIFIFIVVIAAVIAAVTYINSQKPPEEPDVSSQTLTTDALKQLANTDASVGNTSQTLTIQGNAIIAGQTLARGNINIAGNVQTGGSITTPDITVSGGANLGQTQINSLQVATTLAVQGGTTMSDLNVAGTSSFSGAMTAGQITVTRLILSGNAVLEIPNHISFTGSAPSRTINNSVLGTGGTMSVSGSDTSGSIKINTGSSTTAGCFGRLIFRQTYTNEPHVMISPIGIAASQTQYYVERDNTGFNICTANPAPANKSFGFDYFVTN